MKSSRIIAIGGLKNAGKSESAKMLQYCLSVPKPLRNYTCFKLFKNIVPNKYKITSFASSLKRTLSALLEVPIEKFEDRNFKENWYIDFSDLSLSSSPSSKLISENKFSKMVNDRDLSFLTNNQITIRQLMQCFGTEIMRWFFGDKIWILSTLKNKNNIIISDLRFKAEADAVIENNGKLLYIKRDICTPGNHASEKEIYDMYLNNKFEYIIDNNGTLKDLFNSIKVTLWKS